MDESTFQQELHQLQQKVLDMSKKHTSPPNPPSFRDPIVQTMNTGDVVYARDTSFTGQANDAPNHLGGLRQVLSDSNLPASPLHTPKAQAHIRRESLQRQQDNLALPSEPLFWQLFSSLKSDLQRLDFRLGTLDRHIWVLDDRVDGMEPNRFTPPGSIGVSEDARPADSELLQSTNYELGTTHDAIFQATHLARSVSPRHCPCGATHDGLHSASSLYRTSDENTAHDRSVRQAEIQITQDARPRPSICDPFVDLQKSPSPLETLNHHYRIRRAELTAEARPIASTNHAADACLPDNMPSTMLRPQTIEGVQYRDRELARMDELLRNTQDSLKASEQQVVDKENLVQALRHNRAYDVREIESLKVQLSQRDAELGEIQFTLDQRDAWVRKVSAQRDGLSRASRNLTDECAHHRAKSQRLAEELATADEEVERLQRTLEDIHNREADEIDQIVASRDAEICRLKVFCEQKDAVASAQEEVTCRGAELLSERDHEIESLTRSLQVLEDEMAREVRRTSRFESLVEQKSDRLVEEMEGRSLILKTLEQPMQSDNVEKAVRELASKLVSISKVFSTCKPCPRITMLGRNVPYKDIPGFNETPAKTEVCKRSPFVDTDYWRGHDGSPYSWSPRKLPGGKSPHETRRAMAWDECSPLHTVPAPKKSIVFGSPSFLGQPHISDESDAEAVWTAPVKSLAERRPTSVADRRSAPSSEDERKPRPDARRENGRRLPLDCTFCPPLPAPVVHKVSTTADLRSYSRADEHRGVPKRRSMQELPRKRQQAYAETENESGGELGGEV